MATEYSMERIQNVAVVGGGLMGHGVAQFFTQAGYPVTMVNRTTESSARAMAAVAQGLDLFVGEDLSSRASANAALRRNRPMTDWARLSMMPIL